jgi:hypothetical protein
MKKVFFVFVLIAYMFLTFNFKQSTSYHDGDIIFQTTGGQRAQAIQLATHSKYSHCGILFYENGKWMVYEAVQPVSKISLDDFNARGKGTVMRLKNSSALHTKEAIAKLKTVFQSYENKNYDMAFNWSDKELYCSELVYKMYHQGLNIELCKPRKLRDFDLKNPAVKKELNKQYGNKIPLEEPMVAPSDISNSELLELVK